MQVSEALSQPASPTLWRTAVNLFKLRIVALLLLAAFAGAALALAEEGVYSTISLVVLALCGGLAAAGSSALNEYLEREQDQQMARTASRPFPAEHIENGRAVAGIALGMIVLAVLSQLNQEQYGYSLLKRLSSQGLDIDQGTLYPLLRRLESQGLLSSSWNTEGSRPRRYYVISSAGQEIFPRLKAEWKNIVSMMNRMLG